MRLGSSPQKSRTSLVPLVYPYLHGVVLPTGGQARRYLLWSLGRYAALCLNLRIRSTNFGL
jgi:hypothetical protein